jgi:hypothetical protein
MSLSGPKNPDVEPVDVSLRLQANSNALTTIVATEHPVIENIQRLSLGGGKGCGNLAQRRGAKASRGQTVAKQVHTHQQIPHLRVVASTCKTWRKTRARREDDYGDGSRSPAGLRGTAWQSLAGGEKEA